jgi:hypothetical protein
MWVKMDVPAWGSLLDKIGFTQKRDGGKVGLFGQCLLGLWNIDLGLSLLNCSWAKRGF